MNSIYIEAIYSLLTRMLQKFNKKSAYDKF